MADTFRALNLRLELYRGVTRRFRGSLFAKATGGDTVLGRPTAALTKGAALDLSLYPNIRAGIGHPDLDPIPLTVTWETTNPAVFVMQISDEDIEALLELLPDDDKRAVCTVSAWRETGAVKLDEFILAHAPSVTIFDTALRPE